MLLLLNSLPLSFTCLLTFANPNGQDTKLNFQNLFIQVLFEAKRTEIGILGKEEEKKMAYGGAGPVGGSGSASTIKQVKLERESELRIEVGNDAPLRL